MVRRPLVVIVVLAVAGGACWWLAMAGRDVVPETAEPRQLSSGQPAAQCASERQVDEPVAAPTDAVPVRQVVTGAPHDETARYCVLGPLSTDGKARLLAHLDRYLAGELEDVVKRMALRGGDEARPDWSSVADKLTDIDYARARREQVQRDLYLTRKLKYSGSETEPPVPEGMIRCSISPFALEHGGWGMVLIDVPIRPRPGPPDWSRLLAMSTQDARTAWVQEFDARPYEERRAWLVRWTTLSASADAGLAGLSTADLVEWCAYRMLFEHTGITFDGSTAFAR